MPSSFRKRLTRILCVRKAQIYKYILNSINELGNGIKIREFIHFTNIPQINLMASIKWNLKCNYKMQFHYGLSLASFKQRSVFKLTNLFIIKQIYRISTKFIRFFSVDFFHWIFLECYFSGSAESVVEFSCFLSGRRTSTKNVHDAKQWPSINLLTYLIIMSSNFLHTENIILFFEDKLELLLLDFFLRLIKKLSRFWRKN